MGIRTIWLVTFLGVILGASVLIFASDTRLVDLQLKSGHFNDAVRTYRQMLAVTPKDTALRIEFGRLLLHLGDVDGAREQFEAVSQQG